MMGNVHCEACREAVRLSQSCNSIPSRPPPGTQTPQLRAQLCGLIAVLVRYASRIDAALAREGLQDTLARALQDRSEKGAAITPPTLLLCSLPTGDHSLEGIESRVLFVVGRRAGCVFTPRAGLPPWPLRSLTPSFSRAFPVELATPNIYSYVRCMRTCRTCPTWNSTRLPSAHLPLLSLRSSFPSVRRAACAALGELLYYAATQAPADASGASQAAGTPPASEAQSNDPWAITPALIAALSVRMRMHDHPRPSNRTRKDVRTTWHEILASVDTRLSLYGCRLRCLRRGEDDIVRHYATKTLENMAMSPFAPKSAL